MTEEPNEQRESPIHDVDATERWLTRTAALVGLLAFVILSQFVPAGRFPALAAFLGLYLLSKIIVLILRLRARSVLWPATLAEIGALGVVGYVLWSRTAGIISLLAIVALLLAGGMWRRRSSQPLDSDQP